MWRVEAWVAQCLLLNNLEEVGWRKVVWYHPCRISFCWLLYITHMWYGGTTVPYLSYHLCYLQSGTHLCLHSSYRRNNTTQSLTSFHAFPLLVVRISVYERAALAFSRHPTNVHLFNANFVPTHRAR